MANWIFQGNPERFDVMAVLEEAKPIESWSISRHVDDMQPGDNAALWVSGRGAGIYVLGTVAGPPFEEVAGEGWPAEDHGRVMTFASLVLDDFLAGNPITKSELLADPRFSRAGIVTQPQAGNPFLTTDEEWSVIEEMRGPRHPSGVERPSRHRNPTWAWDELILALDLYLRHGLVDDRDSRVIELSEVLNELPIHTVRPDEERFRNPNGVALKLANFAALDPSYDGVGMSRGGKRDATVWDRYHDCPDELLEIAAQLRAGSFGVESFPVSAEEDEDEVEEGRLLYRRHRARERNRALVQRKKTVVHARTGHLSCEICDFDFAQVYGPL
jgi:5-methylcytosine-specific restriction protein A